MYLVCFVVAPIRAIRAQKEFRKILKQTVRKNHHYWMKALWRGSLKAASGGSGEPRAGRFRTEKDRQRREEMKMTQQAKPAGEARDPGNGSAVCHVADAEL